MKQELGEISTTLLRAFFKKWGHRRQTAVPNLERQMSEDTENHSLPD